MTREFEDLKHIIEELLNEEVDEHDPHAFVRAWQARNQRHAANGFRRLAEACPVLEEIEWNMPHVWSFVMRARWSWRVQRDTSGRVCSVSPQEMVWTGCPADPIPAPMDVLIGQELAHDREELQLEMRL